MIAMIPFSGFYESVHDNKINRGLENMLGTSNGDPIDGLMEHAWRANFQPAYLAYAKAYAEAFLDEFEIKGTFESMHSPREYNFTTDRIFCTIEEAEAQRIKADTPATQLAACAAEWFTSRDGFSSSYSPDVEDWGQLDEWDHNQLGCLLEAYVLHKREGKELSGWDEVDLLEHWRGNGGIDDALCACPLLLRLANIASYLRNREERKWK